MTLKRGLAFSSTLSKWFMADAENGGAAKYPVTIMQYSSYFPTLAPARFYHLNNAFPVKWTGPTLDVDSTSVAMESLELAFDDLAIETVLATEGLAIAQMAAGFVGRAIIGHAVE
ncbi:MAG: phage tail protein [Caldilineaceae bacterium]|nr:phage tail protein [Caldilineaceae bacterium]